MIHCETKACLSTKLPMKENAHPASMQSKHARHKLPMVKYPSLIQDMISEAKSRGGGRLAVTGGQNCSRYDGCWSGGAGMVVRKMMKVEDSSCCCLKSLTPHPKGLQLRIYVSPGAKKSLNYCVTCL